MEERAGGSIEDNCNKIMRQIDQILYQIDEINFALAGRRILSDLEKIQAISEAERIANEE